MAEGSGITSKMMAAVALWLQAQTGGNAPKWLVLDGGDVSSISTANAPVSLITATGLSTALATLSLITTTVAADTCRDYYLWTNATAGTTNVTGCETMSASTGGNMLSWHRYAATVALQSTDTIAETIDHQVAMLS